MRQRSFARLTALLVFLVLGGTALALCMGQYSFNPLDAAAAVGGRLGLLPVLTPAEAAQAAPDLAYADAGMVNILFTIRLPRAWAALMVGAMLSLSGAVYQGVFRNPLVSPDLLGVSSGACVGAALAILLGCGMVLRQLLAFVFGILAVLLATAIPRLLRNSSNMMLVLAGIIVSGFMNSALGVMKFMAEQETELSAIVFWQMGSLNQLTGYSQQVAVSPLFLLGTVLLLALSWRINILSFGEAESRTLGMNVPLLRGLVILCASLLTAGAVCISGTIGWIGLVIPHLSRMLIGPDHTKMLPVTVLLGGLFLLVIDTIARAATTVEIPLSILTGLVGAPFFAWLLFRQRARIS